MTKLLVIWDGDDGVALPENKIDAYVADAVSRTVNCRTGADFISVKVGCLTLFNRFRLAPALDNITEDKIIYLVNGVEYSTNKTALPKNFPTTVGAKFDEYLDLMLEVQYK